MRDYGDIVRRVEGAVDEQTRVEVMARIEGYPVYRARRSSGENRPVALLNGGTHGDEPAGVEAALSFLEAERGEWLQYFDFEVIPCLNPYGYVHDTRHNAQDVDVNWAYAREDVPEVQVVRALVTGRRFEFVLDFHEDWESPGYYLYELRRGAPVIGAAITERVRQVCPLNTSAEIEGMAAENGLIAPDANREVERRGAGIPLVMFFEHTDHLLTSESPSSLDIERRVEAHTAVLETVVEAHIS